MRTKDEDYQLGNGKENIPSSHLLDEDGNVDVGAVKSLESTHVGPGVCAEWRRLIKREGADPGDVLEATDADVTRGTIRDHVAGKCRHPVDEPPATYTGGEWVSTERRRDE